MKLKKLIVTIAVLALAIPFAASDLYPAAWLRWRVGLAPPPATTTAEQIPALGMIEEPARYAEPFIKAGADILTFHIEVMPDPRPLVRRIRDLGARPGLVLNPATPASAILPHLDGVDMVLVMTVEPGFTGQKFMPECLDKIAALRREAGPALDIEVDGGINEDTAALTARAGANVAVVGAAVYRSRDMRAAVAGIREAMAKNIASFD